MRLSIHVVTKSRNDCLALLLESLRKQTHKEWDLVLLDNNKGAAQGEPKTTENFLCQAIFQRLQFEGHRIFVADNSADVGPRDIGRYRNMIIAQDPFAKRNGVNETQRTNEIGVRIDDDSILELNYLEILAGGFKPCALDSNEPIGIVGGICPYYWQQSMHAPLPAKFNEVSRFCEWTDNCVNFYRMLDEKGNDRHWNTTFYESGHIRSNYAYRIELARVLKFPEYTGPTGFTEETGFCARAWMLGYKTLINPNAIAWHLAAPHGGGRDTLKSQEQMDKIKADNMAKLKEELTAFRKEKNLEERAYP